MSNNIIYINQIIKQTLQGEGKRLGYPSTLIRVNKCNLKCSFCDSKQTWSDNTIQYIDEKTIDVFIKQILSYKMKNIMLTGGEPLLYANDSIFWKLVETFKNKLEIETNGILMTEEILLRFKQNKTQINLGPKLSSTVYTDLEQYSHLIPTYKQIFNILDKDNYNVKFVYPNVPWEKINSFIKETKCDINNVFLMPLTPNKNGNKLFNLDYKKNIKKTIKKCLENNIMYSPREHINIFDFDIEEKV